MGMREVTVFLVVFGAAAAAADTKPTKVAPAKAEHAKGETKPTVAPAERLDLGTPDSEADEPAAADPPAEPGDEPSEMLPPHLVGPRRVAAAARVVAARSSTRATVSRARAWASEVVAYFASRRWPSS